MVIVFLASLRVTKDLLVSFGWVVHRDVFDSVHIH